MAETFANTAFGPGYWASGGIDDVGAYEGGTAGTTSATLTGTLTQVGSFAIAVIGNQTLTLRAYSDLSDGVLFTTADFSTFYAFTYLPFSSSPYKLSYTVAGQSGLACFVAGTRIATEAGEVPVEALRRGDRVRALRQGVAAVHWVGRRRIAPAGPRAWPVRIGAHAFADGRPGRDLLLSPDHCVFAGGGLVPAHALVNGATVTRVPVPAVDYHHIELAAHDLLLAEGLPAESYRDTGNRAAFDGPGRPRRRPVPACAPHLLARAAQAPVRRHLLARARALGRCTTADPGLMLVAEAGALSLARTGTSWRAVLPPGVRCLRLHSRSAVPAEILADSDDPRRLGLAVTRLVLEGVEIPPADPRRAAGWHRPEPVLHWTDGNALLRCGEAERPRLLVVEAAPLLSYWVT